MVCLWRQEHDRNTTQVASLEKLCRQSVLQNLSVQNVCAGLHVTHLLEPALDDMAASLLTFLSQNLENVLAQQSSDFVTLPLPILIAMLRNPSLVSGVASWLFHSYDGLSIRLTSVGIKIINVGNTELLQCCKSLVIFAGV